MALDKTTAKNLSEFVNNNFSLRKMSISWCQFKSNDLLRFMEDIKNVKHLQYLDISAIPIEGPMCIALTNLIKQHIIMNTSLIHLDMSCCNLDPDELSLLVEGMKRSKSILSVHFSGNSMKPETKKDMLEQLLKTSDKLITTNKPIEKFIKARSEKLSKQLFPNDSESMQFNICTNNDQKMKLDLFKQNLEIKMGLDGDKKKKYETVDDRIVFYRFLGHLEIKGGHMWKMGSRCWLCEKWKYTCVVVNPITLSSNFQSASEFDSDHYHQKIANSSKQGQANELSGSFPMIAGSFSNWKCHNMMKVDKFYD